MYTDTVSYRRRIHCLEGWPSDVVYGPLHRTVLRRKLRGPKYPQIPQDIESLASPSRVGPMVTARRHTLRTRLLACFAGGFLGVVVASPISQSLNVRLTLALIGCSLLGLTLGYVVSIFFDVFTAESEEQSVESPTDKWSAGTIPGKSGGDDGARTRDLRRDRPAF